MSSKPSIPQGTRDFSPSEVRKRQYIFGTLQRMFELCGFQPLETPAMEQLVTLTGKYGEEGDRLIFKILNNGLNAQAEDYKAKMNAEWSKMLLQPYSSPVITERALRYDLTIPFARYVAMHQNDIAFPFRRYQMQPVWRADRPQKGRYREFWQCDADVVGTISLLCEAELLTIYQQAFKSFGLPVAIRINSRKLLAGIAELCGVPDMLTDITVALDKLDKIGWDGVVKELEKKELAAEGVALIGKLIGVKGSNEEQLNEFRSLFANSESGLAGIQELEDTLAYHSTLNADSGAVDNIFIDISLARGLNYYTGVIVEVVCTHPDVKMGSIGGGGRYDDLTGLFGLKGISGVGVSFGIDRIYDLLEELHLFPADVSVGAKVLLVNFGGENERYALQLLRQLRAAGIAAELYPDAAKFDKQMKYANKRSFAYVLLPGDSEREQGKVSVKDFTSGKQELMQLVDCITLLQQ